MENMKMHKGQIYSLDFLIAAGLMVLAIGVLLGYFETATYQGKEARLKNELNAVALTASNILVAKLGCANTDFSAQGYKVYGCYNSANSSGITKQQLMIPDGINCKVMTGNTDQSITGCSASAGDPPSSALDVVSIQRNLLSVSSQLKKADYEKCISQGNCATASGPYTDNVQLVMEVWRQ